MLDSKKTETWYKGVLFLALDSDYSYTQMAEANAKNIKKHSPNTHITVVSNAAKDSPWIDHWILVDFGQGQTRKDANCNTVNWKNLDKYKLYDLSPYERTLVLDCDYYINDISLLNILDSDHDLALAVGFENLLTGRPMDVAYLSDVGVKTHWATVTYFRKTAVAKWIHDRVGFIQENWDYYKNFYHFHAPFRNDYAFSIAIHEFTNGIEDESFSHPYKVMNISAVENFEFDDKGVWVSGVVDGKNIKVNVSTMNFHLLDKNKAARYAIREVLGV